MELLSSSAAPPAAWLPSDPPRLPPNAIPRRIPAGFPNPNPNPTFISSAPVRGPRVLSPEHRGRRGGGGFAASHICEREPETVSVDARTVAVREFSSEKELCAAVRLRVRTFYEFNQSYGIEDFRRYLAEREFEALKERIAGKRTGFQRVSCINATLPLSASLRFADELSSACKYSDNGEDRIVVGTLDLNQCLRLADELTGKRPETTGANLMRAYLSNVCVAVELQRNGLGYALIAKSKKVAREWGITDLYVHVAVDNEAAQKLYEKSGFVYENEEPAWQARFLGRPRRYLLWADLRHTSKIT